MRRRSGALSFERQLAAWDASAPELANFYMSLANRTDVWGGYVPPAYRKPGRVVRTRPARDARGKEFLNEAVLTLHFRGRSPGAVVGLHTTNDTGTSLWGALDFDVHDGAADDLAARVAMAREWSEEVLGERLSLLLEDSNGAGGFHVWARFDQPVPTPKLHAYLSSVAEQCQVATGVRPETYPKQPVLPAGGFGNWLRLPGRHHTKRHVSAVARPGGGWRYGHDAVETILRDWPSSPIEEVPEVVAVTAKPEDERPQRMFASGWGIYSTKTFDRASQIAAYVNRLPYGGPGSGRSNCLFSLARFLRHGMNCAEFEALPVMHAWNRGNAPPLPDQKVFETWVNAGRYADRPFGGGGFHDAA